MEIDVRAVRKMRDSAAAQAAFGPMAEALFRSDADLTEMRVVCDWIQYRNNFRDTAMLRPVLAADETPDGYELAVDMRRGAQAGAEVAAEVTAALADVSPAAGEDRVWLEPWVPGSAHPGAGRPTDPAANASPRLTRFCPAASMPVSAWARRAVRSASLLTSESSRLSVPC